MDDDRRARFEQLYADLGPRVLAYALRRTEPEDARDVVADVFTVAWRRLGRVPEGPAALPWLLVTARNVLGAHQRARRKEIGMREGIATDHAEWIPGELMLARTFSRLRPDDRETLALVAWDGLATGEAARVAGCSTATFAVRLHRARRRLERLLAEADVLDMTTEEQA